MSLSACRLPRRRRPRRRPGAGRRRRRQHWRRRWVTFSFVRHSVFLLLPLIFRSLCKTPFTAAVACVFVWLCPPLARRVLRPSLPPCLQDACLRAQRRDGRGRAGGPLASLLPSNSRTYMASRPPPPTTVSVLLLGRQQFSSDSFFPPHFYQVQISCKLQIARGKGRRRRKRERGGGDGSGGGAKVNTGRRSCALNSQSRPRFVYIRPLDGGRDATQHDGGLRR